MSPVQQLTFLPVNQLFIYVCVDPGLIELGKTQVTLPSRGCLSYKSTARKGGFKGPESYCHLFLHPCLHEGDQHTHNILPVTPPMTASEHFPGVGW